MMIENSVLNVSGMKCGGCEASLCEKLSALEGILNVSASSKEKQVQVEFDATKIDLIQIEKAIRAAGFFVEAC